MSEAAAAPAAPAIPKTVTEETVTKVRHWTDDLFELRVTRPATFRFRSGEFVMLGLMVDGKPLLRAYSVASPSWDEELDFYSIKVQEGPLTSRLQHVKEGDKVLLGRKPTGTLVHDALLPGKRLYLWSTGTGIAPFASVIRDPETYEKFDEVILCHTCRKVEDLAYGKMLVEDLKDDPLCGEFADRLVHYATTTRDESPAMGRITDNIESGKLFADLGIPPLDRAVDRVMICGSMAMLNDLKAICEARGFYEGSNAQPGDFVVERAFVG